MNHEANSNASNALEAGFLVGGGRYTLTRLVERAPASERWQAIDNQLGDELALWIISAEQSDPSFMNALRRAAPRSRKLSHPNIARIFDFVETPGERAVIAMEQVEAANLRQARLDQPGQVFTWAGLQPILAQICAALDYAREEGIPCGNLRPETILVDRRGRVQLADFGLPAFSRVDSAEAAERLPYASPQVLDGAAPDFADDIYALGATLYEALCGSPPFDQGDIPYQIRNVHPQHLVERLVERGVANEIPTAVSEAIMACLAKNPDGRPPHGAAVLRWANQRDIVHEPVSLMPPEPVAPAPVPRPANAIEEAEAFARSLPEQVEKQSNTSRNWIGAVAAALLLLIAGIYWMRSGRENQGEIPNTTAGETVNPPATETSATEEADAPQPATPASTIREVWSTPDQTGGLAAILAEDGRFTVVEQAGQRYWMIPRRAHLYLGVEDALRDRLGNHVEIILEYRNTGSGDIRLHYDSTDQTWPDAGAYKEFPTFVQRMNTGQWRTMNYEITDARFENRQNAGADLRFYNNGDPLLIRRVVIRRLGR